MGAMHCPEQLLFPPKILAGCVSDAVCDSIRFTMDLENNVCIAFVDVLVDRCKFGILIQTYQKTTIGRMQLVTLSDFCKIR